MYLLPQKLSTRRRSGGPTFDAGGRSRSAHPSARLAPRNPHRSHRQSRMLACLARPRRRGAAAPHFLRRRHKREKNAGTALLRRCLFSLGCGLCYTGGRAATVLSWRFAFSHGVPPGSRPPGRGGRENHHLKRRAPGRGAGGGKAGLPGGSGAGGPGFCGPFGNRGGFGRLAKPR